MNNDSEYLVFGCSDHFEELKTCKLKHDWCLVAPAPLQQKEVIYRFWWKFHWNVSPHSHKSLVPSDCLWTT